MASVGVGAPGLVDNTGVLRYAPNLPGGNGLDIAGRLSARLGGLRTVVDNDATCATVAEWAFGAAVGVTDAVMVTLGTGIGGGVVAGGHVVRGASGFARRDRPHGGGPDGAALSVRQAGLLGALRFGERARATGPGGGPAGTTRRGGEPRRR